MQTCKPHRDRPFQRLRTHIFQDCGNIIHTNRRTKSDLDFGLLSSNIGFRRLWTIRVCSPTHIQDFATEHDTAVAATLQELLQLGDVPATSLAIAHLPLSSGGFGLTSASILASSGQWASWADSFPLLQQQLPNLAAQILPQLQSTEGAPPAIQAAQQAAAALTTIEWTPPNWTDLLDGARPSTELALEDP